MKPIVVLFFMMLILILPALYLGFFGVKENVSLRSAGCSEEYDHYLIKPFLKEKVFLSPINDEVKTFNSKMDLILCLCANKLDNSDTIESLYEEALRDYKLAGNKIGGALTKNEFYTQKSNENEDYEYYDFICLGGAKPI